MDNSIIRNNKAYNNYGDPGSGGGIHIYGDYAISINNSIISVNEGYSAFYSHNGDNAVINLCTIEHDNGSAVVKYSNYYSNNSLNNSTIISNNINQNSSFKAIDGKVSIENCTIKSTGG